MQAHEVQELVDIGLLVAGLGCLVACIGWLAWTGRWRDPLADVPPGTGGPGVLSVCGALLALMLLYPPLAQAVRPPGSTEAVISPGSDAFHRDQCAYQVAELLVSVLMIVLLRPGNAGVAALRRSGGGRAKFSFALPAAPPAGRASGQSPTASAGRGPTSPCAPPGSPVAGHTPLQYAAVGRRQRRASVPICIVAAMVGVLILWPIATAQLALGQLIWRWFHGAARLPTHPVLHALRETDWGEWGQAQLVVGAVVFTPIAEELFFRGLVLGACLRYLRRGWLAIIVGAAFFGFVHLSQPQTVLPLVTMGVVLGFVRIRCGAVWPCMLLHGLFNARTMLTALALPELLDRP